MPKIYSFSVGPRLKGYHNIFLSDPARFCNGAFMLPLGDERLKNVIDNTITEINSSGQIKDIWAHYTSTDPQYVRAPALPFQDKGKFKDSLLV